MKINIDRIEKCRTSVVFYDNTLDKNLCGIVCDYTSDSLFLKIGNDYQWMKMKNDFRRFLRNIYY